jgi:hypothetical protein
LELSGKHPRYGCCIPRCAGSQRKPPDPIKVRQNGQRREFPIPKVKPQNGAGVSIPAEASGRSKLPPLVIGLRFGRTVGLCWNVPVFPQSGVGRANGGGASRYAEILLRGTQFVVQANAVRDR